VLSGVHKKKKIWISELGYIRSVNFGMAGEREEGEGGGNSRLTKIDYNETQLSCKGHD
jgi:hypothetical protein